MTGEDVARRKRVRVGVYAVQASMAAIAFAIATPAAAECVTDASGNVVCADTAANGGTLQKDNARLTVSEGAQVSAGSGRAGIVNTGFNTRITISGAVAGGGRPGILVEGGALIYVPCDPYAGASPVYCTPGTSVPTYRSSSSTITVNAGASVTGSSAILLSNQDSSRATVFASIDNAGTLTASNGPALVAGNGTYFGSIQNRASGFIGGISGPISGITNAGTIDGGSNSAISSPAGGANLDNSGTVRSAGSSATFVGSYVYGTNSGTIRNEGAGAAITSANSITFTNKASGTIASGGAVAIQAGGVISLTNQGTIRGSVIAGTDPYGYNASLIDTRKGTITGDVRLGAGNDTVMTRYDAAVGRITSIGGTIDAGAGSNLLRSMSMARQPSDGARCRAASTVSASGSPTARR